MLPHRRFPLTHVLDEVFSINELELDMSTRYSQDMSTLPKPHTCQKADIHLPSEEKVLWTNRLQSGWKDFNTLHST